jgi:biopolymer transport protein ExbB/TolQ
MTMLVAAAEMHTGWLTGVLLNFARGGAEWILWLLVFLSFASFAVFAERLWFLRSVGTDTTAIRNRITAEMGTGSVAGLTESLRNDPSMQARVISYGLRDLHRGPEAVLELCRGALGMEKLRYERGLTVLATVGSNAPFVGLFGTVMGVIMAFDQLRNADAAADTGQSSAVMGAIAEALVATGVGLLVAIPAILFFNILKGRVKLAVTNTGLLVDTLVAYLRSEPSMVSTTKGE